MRAVHQTQAGMADASLLDRLSPGVALPWGTLLALLVVYLLRRIPRPIAPPALAVAESVAPAAPSVWSPNPLTRKHREVLHLAATGLNTDEIADALFIAPETVRGHFKAIFRRLDVHTHPDAIRHAEAHAYLV